MDDLLPAPDRPPLVPEGAVRADGDRFYGAVGPLDVHPFPFSPWDDAWGYTSRWSLRDGSVVGWTAGGTHLRPREHWLAPGVAP